MRDEALEDIETDVLMVGSGALGCGPLSAMPNQHRLLSVETLESPQGMKMSGGWEYLRAGLVGGNPGFCTSDQVEGRSE